MKSNDEGVVSKGIEKLAGVIEKMTEKAENTKGFVPEIIVIAAYSICHFLMMIVHEPWFDEALAWMIAKESTIYEIMFEAPHYEGHPGLWHLILMPFAKLGAPYELSLSIVSFVFATGAVTLFVIKAPFKRLIKWIIPFTYFAFYQYGVVSRPYCMMMLAFVLVSITYGTRNERPLRYVASLAFLCATSAYGIVIAGGLCIVWLIEMARESTSRGSVERNGQISVQNAVQPLNNASELWFTRLIRNMCSGGKIVWLAALLAYALFIIWRILPREDTAAFTVIVGGTETGIVFRLLYTFFAVFSDLVITNVFSDQNALRQASYYSTEMACAVLIGIIILAILVRYGKKHKNLLMFILPYTLYSFFCAMVYMYKHHIGVMLLFIGFWLWQCMEKPERNNAEGTGSTDTMNVGENAGSVGDRKQDTRIIDRITELPLIKSIGTVMMAICIIIPLYWSAGSCICDIATPYSVGRDEYNLILEYGLENCTMLGEWGTVAISIADEYEVDDVTSALYSVCVEPYTGAEKMLNRQITDRGSYSYLHRVPTVEENQEYINEIRACGAPDILLGAPSLSQIYSVSDVKMSDYVLIRQERFGNIWKGIRGGAISHMYIKREIAEEKGIPILGFFNK